MNGLNVAYPLGAAFVHCMRIAHTLGFQPRARFEDSHNLWLVFFRQRHRVSNVIEVAVRNQHRVNAAEFFQRFGAHRVGLYPRVDNDYFPGWRGYTKSRVAEPRQFVPSCFEHERFPRLNLTWTGCLKAGN
jgi:hypothetical protein